MSNKMKIKGGGAVEVTPQRAHKKKIAIVGFTDSRAHAPYQDPEFSIWGLNALFQMGDTVPRADLWFDLHPAHLIEADETRSGWYKQIEIPLLLQDKHADFPTSEKFPAQELREHFRGMFAKDPGEFRYFTSSIAWMAAYALYSVPDLEELHIYGVDMAQDEEYRYQRACVEFWLAIAMGKGVKVYVPDTCDLLKATHEYGFGTDSGLRAKIGSRVTEFGLRLEQIAAQVEKLKQEIRRLTDMKLVTEGAKQDAEWIYQSWCVGDHLSMKPQHPDIEGGNGKSEEAALSGSGDEAPAKTFDDLGMASSVATQKEA